MKFNIKGGFRIEVAGRDPFTIEVDETAALEFEGSVEELTSISGMISNMNGSAKENVEDIVNKVVDDRSVALLETVKGELIKMKSETTQAMTQLAHLFDARMATPSQAQIVPESVTPTATVPAKAKGRRSAK